MQLYINPTSPFVRIVRIALAEKGMSDQVELLSVDPWADDAAFIGHTPAGRVPTLIAGDGTVLPEALLILHHLDAIAPESPILPTGADALAKLARTGHALGVIEASTAIIIGRKATAEFDTSVVGKRRFRTMESGFANLESDLPSPDTDRLGLDAIAYAVAWDYARFRFPDMAMSKAYPRYDTWRTELGDRPSLTATAPK